MPPESCDHASRVTATLPLVLGGRGLRSATRTSQSAFLASWADCLHMVHQRHAPVAELLVRGPFVARFGPGTPTSSKLGRIRDRRHQERVATRGCLSCGTGVSRLCGVPQFDRRRESPREISEWEWCRHCSVHCSEAPLGPHLFPVVSLAFVPPPSTLPSPRTALVPVRPLHVYGHHRAACARAGVLTRRGFALESAAARVCREAGARMTTNVMVRDLDLGVMNVQDTRRLEVIPDGLPLRGGAQLAVDTTIVSALHCDGTSQQGAANVDGVRLLAARRRKERTYPDLVTPQPLSFGRPCQ